MEINHGLEPGLIQEDFPFRLLPLDRLHDHIAELRKLRFRITTLLEIERCTEV
ncbi:MAG: hypothetical protein A4E42_01389 [Methanoregulaceae archaeon PtaU1.Bin222]|nr:MAG: hypothetical protein A4E42_01389 [Methanoregulaceae archaeon PtaU1.Bin222]